MEFLFLVRYSRNAFVAGDNFLVRNQIRLQVVPMGRHRDDLKVCRLFNWLLDPIKGMMDEQVRTTPLAFNPGEVNLLFNRYLQLRNKSFHTKSDQPTQ